MRWILPILAALGVVLAAPPGASAQFERDQWESSKGEGSGKDRTNALKQAKRSAVYAKLVDLVKEKNLEDYSEDRTGIKDVLRNSAAYCGRVDVVKEKSTTLKGKDGKPVGKRVDISISTLVNMSKLHRDFEKARRIAALRRFGEKIGVLFHEEAVISDEEKEACWNFLGAIGAERTFMLYKFRPLPMGTVRETFKKAVEEGKKLEDPELNQEMVEALAGIGAHIRILGRITLTPQPDVKDEEGNRLKEYAATGWAELHTGDKFHREKTVDVKRDEKSPVKGRGETVELAREAAFKAAGEALSFDLAGALVDKLEEKKDPEEEEEPKREVTLLIE
ncbi:MAG: hypothetical protein ACYTHM_25700, partial [Planctomycetota bacterium]